MGSPSPRALPFPSYALAAGLALTTACSTTPIAPVPQPLPETLAWAAGGEEGAGAFLGLQTRENLSGSFDELDFQAGVRVTRVVENSPAAEAGLRTGDVVRSLAGHPTNDPASLEALLRDAAPGESALVVQRGDTVFEVPVVLREALGRRSAAAEPVCRLDPARSRAGWLTGRGGVVLVSSHPGAPFPKAGVEVGSVVLAVDGAPMRSDRELIRALQRREPGARVDVDFRDPGGEERRARVALQDQPRELTRLSIPILLGYHADLARDETSLVVLDLWLFSLMRYERSGEERSWRFLRFFRFATGVGELTE